MDKCQCIMCDVGMFPPRQCWMIRSCRHINTICPWMITATNRDIVVLRDARQNCSNFSRWKLSTVMTLYFLYAVMHINCFKCISGCIILCFLHLCKSLKSNGMQLFKHYSRAWSFDLYRRFLHSRHNGQIITDVLEAAVATHWPQNELCAVFLCFLVEFITWSWRRGSVVRTSVSDWRTFPDLCLIYGWHVTISWVRCPLWSTNQANSAFHPSWVGKWVVIHVITWITGWRPLNGRQAAYGWLVIGQPVGAGHRPYASSVCDINSTSAVAVCGLRCYTSVICLSPVLY